jgi:sucrose-6F-phosphate phosphohydrolase
VLRPVSLPANHCLEKGCFASMAEKILICTDLDRTLLPNGEPPESEHARELFARFCQQPHVTLVYVSGRDRRLLLEAIEEYQIPLPDYAIGDVGTSIYHIEDNHWQLDPDWSSRQENDWAGRHRQDLEKMLAPVTALEIQEAEKQNTFKLSYYLPLDIDQKQVLEEMHSILDADGIRANIIWSIDDIKHIGLVDVLPQAANKLEAIRFLNRRLGVSLERTIFSGDSGNDLSVLTSEIPATLVANASDEVRREAVQLAEQGPGTDRLYLARGDFRGLNGNYSAGILEGIHHYLDDTHSWFDDNTDNSAYSSPSSSSS